MMPIAEPQLSLFDYLVGEQAHVPSDDIVLPTEDNTPEALQALLAANALLRSRPWPAPYDHTTHTLRLGDARDLSWIENNSVHLVVTSPPYWTLKQYNENRDGQMGDVGINHAQYTVGYEGERAFRTDGKSNRHPYQEAPEAERRLLAEAAPHFDEFIVLHYSATNEPPFPFSWVNLTLTSQNYGSSLVRISREYDRRF